MGYTTRGGEGATGPTGPTGPEGPAGPTGPAGPAGAGFVDAGVFSWNTGSSTTKVPITGATTSTVITGAKVSTVAGGGVIGGIITAYPGLDTDLTTSAPGFVTFHCSQALYDGKVQWIRTVL